MKQSAVYNVTDFRYDKKTQKFAYLEINHEPVDLASVPQIQMRAWKHSSDYLYSLILPSSAGSVKIYPISSGKIGAATTGTYVEATAEQTHDVWKMGADFYGSHFGPTSEPDGTAGTPVDLGDAVVYTIGGIAHWYQVEGTGDDKVYTEILSLGTSAFVLGEVVSDVEIITVLNTKTPAEVDYIEYTEAAVPAHITYSSNDYTRSSGDDVLIKE